jgi:hypothetical protein
MGAFNRSEGRRACSLPAIIKYGFGGAAIDLLILGYSGGSVEDLSSSWNLAIWAAMYASYVTSAWREDTTSSAISGQ